MDYLMKILNVKFSMSKFVLGAFAVTACLTFARGTLAEQYFVTLAASVFSYYFGRAKGKAEGGN